MSLIIPAEKKIHIVQDTSKFKWAGVPFQQRYSSASLSEGLKSLVQKMRGIDVYLDLKFYLPTEKWHVVRHLDRSGNHWTRVWELDDRPDLGLRKEPGEWIIDGLKAGDTWGHAANRPQEIEENNRKIDESNQRAIDDACGEASKELRKPLQHLYDFGDNGSFKGIY